MMMMIIMIIMIMMILTYYLNILLLKVCVMKDLYVVHEVHEILQTNFEGIFFYQFNINK